MKKKLDKKSVPWIFLMLLIGGAGAVSFFPLNLESRYTCLYHRWRSGNKNCQMRQQLRRTNESGYQRTEANTSPDSQRPEQFTRTSQPSSSGILLNTYLQGYAFLWWGSLILVAAGGFLLGKIRI
ncbi:MAG: hypothetical protein WAN36_15335 [Calditrichia bacterium]